MPRALATICASVLGLSALAQGAPVSGGGLQRDVVFTDYSPLSSNAELVRRLLTPLTAAQVPLALARSGKVLPQQPVDLGKERFLVYAPAKAPPGGFGLLVFVPPWQDAQMPQGWASVLDRFGLIFVSATRSGNDQDVVSRRAPLALLGAANISRRYPINPDHVYIGGFSGGARVAMRLALGYPDIFSGALLNSGGDPIGDEQAPLPPRDLFLRFQEGVRLVYITGEHDSSVLGEVASSTQSMRQWCVFDVDAQVMPGVGHDAANPSALARALEALIKPAAPDPARLAACRAGIEQDLAGRLQQAEALTAAGKHDEARKLLIRIDRRFGGLAAPRIFELAR